MSKQKNVIKSLSLAGLALFAAGCGSKVGGTYTLSAVSTGGSSIISNYCQSIVLQVTDNSNVVSATGSGGQGCTENLQGTDSGNSIMVTSFTVSVQGITCTFNSGTLTVNNNVLSGTVTSTNTYGQYQNYCGTSLTLNGTKTN